MKLDPSNQQLKEGLEQAKATPGPKGDGLFGPQFMAKLAMDPTTRGYLSQPDFMQMLQMLQKNPSMMSGFMQDQRFSHALSVRPWPSLHVTIHPVIERPCMDASKQVSKRRCYLGPM